MGMETKWRQKKKESRGKGREGTDGREGNSTNADVYGLRLNQQQVGLQARPRDLDSAVSLIAAPQFGGDRAGTH